MREIFTLFSGSIDEGLPVQRFNIYPARRLQICYDWKELYWIRMIIIKSETFSAKCSEPLNYEQIHQL